MSFFCCFQVNWFKVSQSITGTEDNNTIFSSAVLAQPWGILLIQQLFSRYISLDSLPHLIFIPITINRQVHHCVNLEHFSEKLVYFSCSPILKEHWLQDISILLSHKNPYFIHYCNLWFNMYKHSFSSGTPQYGHAPSDMLVQVLFVLQRYLETSVKVCFHVK